MLENKDIKFGVYWEDHGAARGFTNLDKEIEKTDTSAQKLGKGFSNANSMLMSTSRIVQDMPYGLMGVGNNITFLAEQMGYAKSQGVSFKDQLIGLGKSLIGPGGMIFLISAATSALTAYSMGAFGGKKATDEFAKSIDNAIKKLIEFQDPLKNLKFGLSPDDINRIIPAIDKEIKSLEDLNKTRQTTIGIQSGVSTQSFNSGILLNQLTEKEKERNSINEQLIKNLKEIKNQYESQLKVSNIMDSLGIKRMNTEKSTTDELKRQKNVLEEIKKITGFSADGKRMPSADRGLSQPFANIMGEQNGGKDKAQMADMTSGYKKNLEFMVDIMKDNLQIIKSEWNNMWEDVFGEANSLFEKFMSNMLEKLAEQALTNLAGSLLNIILPGAGSAFQALSGSPSYGGGGVIQNNIIIGERQVATIYTSGKQAASRLRM